MYTIRSRVPKAPVIERNGAASAVTDASVYPVSRYLLCAGSLWFSVTALAEPSQIDMDNGEEINEVCAGCHGEYGEGGKQGEYPRIAGQPPAVPVDQLILFRERKRPNLAMVVEYVDDRQIPTATSMMSRPTWRRSNRRHGCRQSMRVIRLTLWRDSMAKRVP